MVVTRRECRVGPGNFTPSPSQNRTGYSRIIRLVPSREGCRLPLNEGLLPANQLAQISRDDPPPSLHEHYTRFTATTRQSAPLRRFGTFGLAVGAACAFSLAIAGQVLPFHTGARSSFAPPHAGCRSGSIMPSPELIPEVGSTPGFGIA